MKERKVFSILLMAIVAFIFCSCSNNAKVYPKLYFPCVAFFPENGMESRKIPEGKEPTDEQMKICEEVFERTDEFYGVAKARPRVRCLTVEEMEALSNGFQVKGTYVEERETIYISEEFSVNDRGVLCHEYIHSLSDNGDRVGFSYIEQGNLMGSAFNEGATNLLSTRLYGYSEEDCVYEYETHVADLFSSSYGDDEFVEAFFASDVESLKTDFNSAISEWYPYETVNSVKCDPFDVFVGSVQSYYCSLKLISQTEDTGLIEPIMYSVNSCEETMLFYATSKNNRGNAQKRMKDLVKNEKMITWSYYSAIPYLAEI